MENKETRKWIIETAMGLQGLSGFKNSPFFLAVSQEYIEGEITLDELEQKIISYYAEKHSDDKKC